MRIGGFDTDRRVLIVAEIGNNHEGDARLAERMIDVAAEAGADAIKLQAFRTEAFVSPADRARVAQLRRFELDTATYRRLGEHARAKGLRFVVTPLDLETAGALAEGADAVKVASGDLTFAPLLETLAATGRPLILSCGLATTEEVARAREYVHGVWARRGSPGALALLHCVSSYPVPLEEANLAGIATLKAAFGETVGYSDHTLGTEAAALAVAAGARIVEKHFTLDKRFSDFRDHALSADPADLAQLVERIRTIEMLMGDGARAPRPCERDAVATLRRSICAKRALPAGHTIGHEDLLWLRPAGGLAPGREAELVGRTLGVAVEAGAMLTRHCLQERAARVRVP